MLKLLRLVYCISSLSPIAGSLLLYSFALRARLILGYWPSYNAPDPKDLGLVLHHGSVAIAFIISFVGAIAWPIFAFLVRHRLTRREKWLGVLMFVAALGLAIFELYISPNKFFEWYLD